MENVTTPNIVADNVLVEAPQKSPRKRKPAAPKSVTKARKPRNVEAANSAGTARTKRTVGVVKLVTLASLPPPEPLTIPAQKQRTDLKALSLGLLLITSLLALAAAYGNRPTAQASHAPSFHEQVLSATQL